MPAKNRAWDLLCDAKEAYDRVHAEHGLTRRRARAGRATAGAVRELGLVLVVRRLQPGRGREPVRPPVPPPAGDAVPAPERRCRRQSSRCRCPPGSGNPEHGGVMRRASCRQAPRQQLASARLPVFDRRRAGVLLPLSAIDGAARARRPRVHRLAGAGRLFGVADPARSGRRAADGSPYWVRSDCAGNAALPRPGGAARLASADRARHFRAACAAGSPDYALFEALTRALRGAPFWHWPQGLRERDPQALAQARAISPPQLERIEREQCAFHVQWQRLREHARSARRAAVRRPAVLCRALLGRDLGAPRAVPAAGRRRSRRPWAGCRRIISRRPGSCWGNPLYDWAALRAERLRLVARARARRSSSAWICCASITSARSPRTGPCRRAPRMRAAAPGRRPREVRCCSALQSQVPDLPLVAEDLGVITPDVIELMRAFCLPGMRVLQFAFDGDPMNPHLPYQHPRDVRGLHRHARQRHDARLVPGTGSAHARARGLLTCGCAPGAMPEALVRAALASVGAAGRRCPVQDLLGLGLRGALQHPGHRDAATGSGALPAGRLSAELAQQLRAPQRQLRPRLRLCARFAAMRRMDASALAARCARGAPRRRLRARAEVRELRSSGRRRAAAWRRRSSSSA